MHKVTLVKAIQRFNKIHRNYVLKILSLCFLSSTLFFISSLCMQNSQDRQLEGKSEYNIVILFHLYNLNLMDEFITRINDFIKRNNQNTYYIKIAVPIGSNITNYTRFDTQEKDCVWDREKTYNACTDLAAYHPEKITRENCIKLYILKTYLENNLCVDQDKIQILFIENRGVDVGSFLLLLDQLIQQNIQHDFVVKLHTKTHEAWRKRLLSILDLNINEFLRTKECIYACECFFSTTYHKGTFFAVLPHLNRVLDYFKLPHKNDVSCCAGTMFIVSSKITDFFRNYDRITLFNMLNLGFPKGKSLLLEHGIEVFLGYCFDYLQLKKLTLSDFWPELHIFSK